MMKTVLCLFFLSFGLVNAQEYSVLRSSITMEKGLRAAIKVQLEPDAKNVSNELRSYLRSKYAIRLKGGWKNRRAEEIVLKPISDSTVSIYIQFNSIKEGTEFFVTIKGDDFYTFEAHDDAFNFIETIINDFLKSYLPNYYNALISDVNKVVSKLDKSIRSNKKSIDKNQKAIAKNKDRIRSLEDDTKKRERDNEDLQRQQSEAEQKNAAAKSELEQKIKKLESAKSQLMRP